MRSEQKYGTEPVPGNQDPGTKIFLICENLRDLIKAECEVNKNAEWNQEQGTKSQDFF